MFCCVYNGRFPRIQSRLILFINSVGQESLRPNVIVLPLKDKYLRRMGQKCCHGDIPPRVVSGFQLPLTLRGYPSPVQQRRADIFRKFRVFREYCSVVF